MNLSKIAIKHETIGALRSIRHNENNEEMVDLRPISDRLFFHTDTLDRDHGTFARKTIANKLLRALNHIPNTYSVHIRSAYRSVDEQRKIYEKIRKRLLKKNPTWPDNILIRETNKFVFPVDKEIPPFHSTGGAVDVFLTHTSGRLCKHCDVDRFDESQHAHPGLSKAVRKHREIIRNAMTGAGFTNYPMEYWHWSWGDSGWALRTNNKVAHYGDASHLLK